jgi:hypothetical protein
MLAVILWIGRTAIDAAKIAAIGHRNAQVRDLPAVFVVEAHDCPPEMKNPIRTWNRVLAENLHISGRVAPFQAREA